MFVLRVIRKDLMLCVRGQNTVLFTQMSKETINILNKII